MKEIKDFAACARKQNYLNTCFFTAFKLKYLKAEQGCCLTGAWAPGAPKLRVRATKFLFKEPGWAPKHRFSILI